MKQDRKLIAQKDYSEVSTIVTMLRKKNPGSEINRVTVKDVFWNTGRSRVIAYAIFNLMGYRTAKTYTSPSKEQQKKIKDIAQRMGL